MISLQAIYRNESLPLATAKYPAKSIIDPAKPTGFSELVNPGGSANVSCRLQLVVGFRPARDRGGIPPNLLPDASAFCYHLDCFPRQPAFERARAVDEREGAAAG